MYKNLLRATLIAAGVSTVLSGCNTINANQDLTKSIPQTFEYVSHGLEGTDQENQMKIVVEGARTVKANDESDHSLELHFTGRFYHNNPKIKTDTPFRAKAGIGLKHHGEGIVSIQNPDLLAFDLFSVHTPTESLVYREAHGAFRKTVNSLNGQYLPEQKLLKLESNLKALFAGK